MTHLTPILSAALFFAAAGGFAQNLLENPSFEQPDPKNPSLPEGWKTMQQLSLGKHHFVDETVAAEGKKSIRIENDNPSLGIKAYLLFIQKGLESRLTKECPPGTPMEFSVLVRADSARTRFRIYMETMQAERHGGAFSTTIQGAPVGEWKRVVLRFKMPEQPFTSAYVCFQLISTGKIWFDDAYLGKESGAPKEKAVLANKDGNRIVNPSLEETDSGTGQPVGWKTLQMNLKGNFFSLDSAKAHSGKNALRIACDDPKLSDNNYLMWQQDNLQTRLKDCPPGTPMVLSFQAENGSDPSVKFRAYVEMRAGGKFIGTFLTGAQTSYVGWKTFTLKFKMPKEIPDSAYVCFQLLTPGKVWFDDIRLEKESDRAPAAVEKIQTGSAVCRVTDFPPRQTWFLPDVPKKLTVSCEFPKDAAGKGKAELTDARGKVLKTYPLNAKETVLELPPLGKGTYFLNYEAGSLREQDVFRVADPVGKGVRFDSERRMSLNGKPFFPRLVLTPAMSEEALRVYQAAGFNAIAFNSLTSNADAARYLGKTAAQYGLAVVDWGNLGDVYKGDAAAIAGQLARRVQNARGLDNFIGWLDDESEMRLVPLERLRTAYNTLFEIAPEYVVWQNHAPRLTDPEGAPYGSFANVRRYSRVCDVTGIDIYPVPEGGGHSNLENKTVSCVGEYTDLVLDTVYRKKPVWMVLQAGAWSEESGGKLNDKRPRPTYEQFRFMFYNALTHGATGLVFYGPAALPDIYSSSMGMMADVNHEFKAIESFFLEGKSLDLKAQGELKNVRIFARTLGNDTLVIVVNEGKESRKITLPLPDSDFYRLPSGDKVKGGPFSAELKGNEVLILSTRKAVIPKHPAFTPKPPEKSVDKAIRDGGALQPIRWNAQWVSHPKLYRAADKTTFVKQTLELPESPSEARVRVAADDSFRFTVNGQKVGEASNHAMAHCYNLVSRLKKGKNELTFELHNNAGPSGLLFEGEFTAGGKTIPFASGKETVFSEDGMTGWVPAEVHGVPPAAPWGPVNVLIAHP